MQATDDPIVRRVGQWLIAGSHGELLVSETGEVLQYQRARVGELWENGVLQPPTPPTDSYEDIRAFDIAEYIQWWGEMDDTDILLIGYWTIDGNYTPPEEDARCNPDLWEMEARRLRTRYHEQAATLQKLQTELQLLCTDKREPLMPVGRSYRRRHIS